MLAMDGGVWVEVSTAVAVVAPETLIVVPGDGGVSMAVERIV